MQLHRVSPENTEYTSMTAGIASRGRVALLVAGFLFSYLAGHGHAQTAVPGSVLQTNDTGSDDRRRATGSVITINPTVTHQTMRGWEVTAQADQFRPDYAAYQSAVLDKVVEAGINRVRLD